MSDSRSRKKSLATYWLARNSVLTRRELIYHAATWIFQVRACRDLYLTADIGLLLSLNPLLFPKLLQMLISQTVGIYTTDMQTVAMLYFSGVDSRFFIFLTC